MEKTTNQEKIKILKGKLKESKEDFKRELRKSLSIAAIAAFSFVIGLSWNNLITGYVNEITQLSPLKGQLISTLIITVVGVLGILIATKINSRKKL